MTENPFRSRASISGRTRVVVIVADPIGHVRTPQAMNAHYDALGRDAVLVPVHVAPADLPAVVEGLRRMRSLDGIIVTVPHKEAVARLCDDLTGEARLVGAVNAVRRDPDGRLIGGQFDGEGFVAGLRAAGREVTGKRVLMAGSGGAAAGIGFALLRHGVASLTVHNRTAARAESLVERLRGAFPDGTVTTGSASPAGHDIIVNATSLGLKPGEALPVDAAGLAPPMLAAEVVMEPEVTPFLAEAARRGCGTHSGRPMLAEQLAILARFVEGRGAETAD